MTMKAISQASENFFFQRLDSIATRLNPIATCLDSAESWPLPVSEAVKVADVPDNAVNFGRYINQDSL